MLWTNSWVSNTWVSNVNKTTFASDMFRVFLFSSHEKFNWLLLKNLCSGFFTLVNRTFRKLDFFYSAVSASAPLAYRTWTAHNFQNCFLKLLSSERFFHQLNNRYVVKQQYNPLYHCAYCNSVHHSYLHYYHILNMVLPKLRSIAAHIN